MSRQQNYPIDKQEHIVQIEHWFEEEDKKVLKEKNLVDPDDHLREDSPSG